MVDAAVEGLVDFRQSRQNDPKWWRWLQVLTQGLLRRKQYLIADATYRYQLAQISHGNLTPDSFAKVQDSARECYYDVIGALQPWEGQSYKARMKHEFRDYRQQYIDAFGVDPADPAFKAWEAAHIAALNAGEIT